VAQARIGAVGTAVLVPQDAVRWPHTALRGRGRGRPAGGWETVLSKYFRGGRELSGGQWQRLAVARGVFCDVPVLVCDEPTAPLDARAESRCASRCASWPAGARWC
jgi:ABC-type multidrug transport system fused ATPase/permease subunit